MPLNFNVHYGNGWESPSLLDWFGLKLNRVHYFIDFPTVPVCDELDRFLRGYRGFQYSIIVGMPDFATTSEQ